ncbi:site-specific integrase [candidate division TA06 bacterium]|uniref:Site-specific integrase n=1 Tax=candidate division TA06 bacterium TaxID=2250710 RepID=A0A523UX54_UNCT6|nr:MAG: site-specific integrase [candidate division TA06 bacterium]
MKVKSLQELLDIFVVQTADRNRVAMTKTAVRHTIKALGVKSASEIPVSAFDGMLDILESHLKKQNSSRVKVRNNKSFLKRLTDWGRKRGLVSTDRSEEVSTTWRDTIEAYEHRFGRKGSSRWYGLGKWASSKGLGPADLAPSDLTEFAQSLQGTVGCVEWRRVYHDLETMWAYAAPEGVLPYLRFPSIPHKFPPYRLPLEEWPSQMQKDYQKYRSWATDDFVRGRPKRNKQNISTATKRLKSLERCAGYFVNVLGIPKDQLDLCTFLDEYLIRSFFSWLRSKRRVGDITLMSYVDVLISIGLHYIKANKEEMAWLCEMKAELRDARPKDKSGKMVSLNELRSVPERLKQERLAFAESSQRQRKGTNQKRLAIMIRNELIIRILIARPLRSSNLRNARLGDNIFCGSHGTWQIVFRNEETKTGNLTSYSFPEYLEPYLKEYLEEARPILARHTNSKVLFPSVNGRPLGSSMLHRIVTQACLKHLGKAVNPHLVRDIVTTGIVEETGNIQIASKLLGHASVKTTERYYSHFKMEDAAKAYDRMLQSMPDPRTILGNEASQTETETVRQSHNETSQRKGPEKQNSGEPQPTQTASGYDSDKKGGRQLPSDARTPDRPALHPQLDKARQHPSIGYSKTKELSVAGGNMIKAVDPSRALKKKAPHRCVSDSPGQLTLAFAQQCDENSKDGQTR